MNESDIDKHLIPACYQGLRRGIECCSAVRCNVRHQCGFKNNHRIL